MRLGQVEENGVRTMIAVESLAEFLRQMKQDEEALREKKRVLQTQTIQDKQDSQSIRSDLIQSVSQEELQIAVLNAWYKFHMAHSNIDSRTGKRECL